MEVPQEHLWIWDELCPENVCRHSLRVHNLTETDHRIRFVCTVCTCHVTWSFVIGTLMAMRKESGLPEVPEPSEIEARPVQVPEDLFDPVVGYDEVKWLLRRSLASKRMLHFLFVGPPASAKSLLLMELERLDGAYYAVGSSSSRAGLRQLLLDLNPRILLIDEIDKVHSSKDYAVLLSLMESGVVTETMYKRRARKMRHARVFAAANADDGLTPELKSRFVILRFRPYTLGDFLMIAERVLVDREGIDPSLAEAIAMAVWEQLRSRDIRDAVKIARLVETPDELPRVVEVLRNYR